MSSKFSFMFRSVVACLAVTFLASMMGAVYSMDAAGRVNEAAIVPVLSFLLDDEFIDPTLPLAEAGPNSDVIIGELVTLDGSASSDPEARPLTYLWTFDSMPAGSTASFNLDTSVTPEFVLDLPGTYIVQLVVNNGIKNSVPDVVTITNTNRAPIADAGDNSIVLLAQAVQLDASASTDIDTNPLTYLWSLVESPEGSLAQLSDPTLVNPVFTPDTKGNYIFSLIVNDGIVDSDADQREVLAGLELDLDVADSFFGVSRETTATLRLDSPAPPHGVVITLSVDETIIGLAETMITFAAGESEKTVTLTGLNIGVTTISALGTNIPEVSVSVEVSDAVVFVDEIEPLSPSSSRNLAIFLSHAAPMGGVTINLASLDTDVATVAPMSVFIDEGQFAPIQNVQVTGVDLGSTTIRASADSFAPDERVVRVAFIAEFDPSTLNVPETLSRDIVLSLDVPAPLGGLTFDLTIIGNQNVGVQSNVNIDEGQIQSQPISLTGLMEGVATLRATAAGAIDAEAAITVVDAPDVFLNSSGSSAHLSEAVVGVVLQDLFQIRLGAIPSGAVDVRVSVPENSGVLLSSRATLVGANVLVYEDIVSSRGGFFHIQGVQQGDDVPVSIEVFNANTTTLAGYEALPSTVDVDPSGVYLSSSDFTVTTFTTNRRVSVQTALLYDIENASQNGAIRRAQSVRAGTELQVPMQVNDTSILELPDGPTGTIIIRENSGISSIPISPAANGVARVSIVNQPAAGFSLPSDQDDNVQITVVAPNVFLGSTSGSRHIPEAVVGIDLQQRFRIGFQAFPPSPVDVHVSVPENSGVLLAPNQISAGSTQIIFEDVISTNATSFSIQGLALGDDVPITINVFNANTTTEAGFDALASTVDVDPSGFYVSTSDYTTTTFSNDRTISVFSTLLFDAETPTREGQRFTGQSIRGGLNLTVPMQVSDATIISLPAGANDDLIFAGGGLVRNILVTPEGAGQATVSIASLPGNFAIPVNSDDNTVVTVTAPDAFLRSTGSASYLQEAIVGIDLQSAYLIGLAATPPAPVDIVVSVAANSGVLLSTDATLMGGTSLLFDNVTGPQSPQFFIQGVTLGDDVDFTLEVFEAGTTNPIGYNVLSSTVDVDPSGVSMNTADYQTNTFAPDRSISAIASLLYDDEDIFLRDGQRRQEQQVRGGVSLNVPMFVDNDTVVTLPSGASDILTISAGQNTGSILVDPLTTGQATVAITAQPNGNFTLPSNRDGEVFVVVTAPGSGFTVSNVFVGDELQIPIRIFLAETPPNPVDVTVEVSSAAIALVSKDATAQGGASVTFENVTSASAGTIYVQGLTLKGATQIKVSTPGYSDGTANVEVVNSGFMLSRSFNNIDVGSTRDFTIDSTRLNANGTLAGNQQIRGGVTFDIVASSSVPAVGTITSPVTIIGGSGPEAATFTAISSGTTTIQITQPAGFTPPVGRTDGDITVN